jgi:hypothetical protein
LQKQIFIENRNIEEARAIFGDDFNFDGSDFNQLNDDMDGDDLEDDDDDDDELEEDVADEEIEPKYDEDGNLIEEVRNNIFQEDTNKFSVII